MGEWQNRWSLPATWLSKGLITSRPIRPAWTQHPKDRLLLNAPGARCAICRMDIAGVPFETKITPGICLTSLILVEIAVGQINPQHLIWKLHRSRSTLPAKEHSALGMFVGASGMSSRVELEKQSTQWNHGWSKIKHANRPVSNHRNSIHIDAQPALAFASSGECEAATWNSAGFSHRTSTSHRENL